MIEFSIKTSKRLDSIDLSEQVQEIVSEQKMDDGAVIVYTPHTTSSITINENADPDVLEDMHAHLSKLVPVEKSFKHGEGNSDSHIKTSLVGSSVIVPVENGKLALGTWQGILFLEFDGPRSRKVLVQFLNT
jgi:secondary thiamine-phosphate synthase enzyme